MIDKDTLLWESLESLWHLYREVERLQNKYEDYTNIGDPAYIILKLEQHFGVEK